MTTTSKLSFSAGENPLENFYTLAKYAAEGSEEVQRRIWARGQNVTIIKDGNIVEIAPDGTEKVIQASESQANFEPLVAGSSAAS